MTFRLRLARRGEKLVPCRRRRGPRLSGLRSGAHVTERKAQARSKGASKNGKRAPTARIKVQRSGGGLPSFAVEPKALEALGPLMRALNDAQAAHTEALKPFEGGLLAPSWPTNEQAAKLERQSAELSEKERALADGYSRALAPIDARLEEFGRRFSPEDWSAVLRLHELMRKAEADPAIRKSDAVSGFLGYLVEAIADRPHELVHTGPVEVLREVVAAGRTQDMRRASDAAHADSRAEWSRCLKSFDARRREWRNYAEAARTLFKDFAVSEETIKKNLKLDRPDAYPRTPGRPTKART
jgi:hypothetical protein